MGIVHPPEQIFYYLKSQIPLQQSYILTQELPAVCFQIRL